MINQGSLLICLTFALLAGAICVVWIKHIQFGKQMAIAPWAALFGLSIVSGVVAGVLHPVAIISIGLFCAITYFSQASRQSWTRLVLGVITVILALALAMHRLPGFSNPIVIATMKLSPDAIEFTQYANFDKVLVGLVLLALVCKKVDSFSEWRAALKRVLFITLISIAGVLGIAFAIGFVKFDLKLTQITILFLVINLFLTVVAEEAFFRGFLQDRLASSLARFRFGYLFAVLCSAMLFGLAHFGGGATYMLLATLAGFGFAYAYHVTQRIEAPIFCHFTLNAVHFIVFTYPHIN